MKRCLRHGPWDSDTFEDCPGCLWQDEQEQSIQPEMEEE